MRIFICRSQGKIQIEYSSAFRNVLSGSWCLLRGHTRAEGHEPVPLVLGSAEALSVCFCCFSGPGAETQLRPICIQCRSVSHWVEGLMLKGYSPAPLSVPLLGVSNTCGWQHAREERSGESLNCMTSERKVRGQNRKPRDILGEGRSPWWPGPCFPSFACC